MNEWLKTGWILELRERENHTGAGGQFIIGSSGICPKHWQDLSERNVQIDDDAAVLDWPDFYFDADVDADVGVDTGFAASEISHRRWSVQISRNELRKFLEGELKGIEFLHGKTGQHLVEWQPPSREKFFAAVDLIKKEISKGELKKAVPVVCATGTTITSNTVGFFIVRLLRALNETEGTGLRIFGKWDESGRGALGITPEDLFRIERVSSNASSPGDLSIRLKSMAVAGTAAAPGLGLLADPKEREEHQIVIGDLQSKFHFLIEDRKLKRAKVEVGETSVQLFHSLAHLVTPVELMSTAEGWFGAGDRGSFLASAGLSQIKSLLAKMHPTPALGVYPQTVGLEFLKRLDQTTLDGQKSETLRGRFGAPFTVVQKDKVDSVVAIRQICWRPEEVEHHGVPASDIFNEVRLQIEVLSGCGIVAPSEPEKEWSELYQKRQAVISAFGLSLERRQPVHFASQVLEALYERGVRKFIVCAGARSAPLVTALTLLKEHSLKGIEIKSFFDERAASFFALGMAKESGVPVAVITTSGTAVTELHSAMAEADQAGVPLIALTADRPKRLRYTGAPQSIPQDGIFSRFISYDCDLEEGDVFELPVETSMRPWHINVCFEEPLLGDAKLLAETAAVAKLKHNVSSRSSSSKVSDTAESDMAAIAALNQILRARRQGLRVMAIVGGLEKRDREPVRDFLFQYQIPCVLEGPSGLRGARQLQEIEIFSGESLVQETIKTGTVHCVLRIGTVPTTRAWRDLDDTNVKCQTVSLSRSRFSGLGRGRHFHLRENESFRELFLRLESENTPQDHFNTHLSEDLFKSDRSRFQNMTQMLTDLPNSEPAWIERLSRLILDANTASPTLERFVFVGNSLPIRLWDLAASRTGEVAVRANRGVNGIDGQVSTALGMIAAARPREAWIIVGDLTALYDLSAPWALRFHEFQEDCRIRLIVLNNSGGMIFRKVLRESVVGSEPFENRHQQSFEDMAKMWSLSYRQIKTSQELEKVSSDATDSNSLWEIIPDAEETETFWKALR